MRRRRYGILGYGRDIALPGREGPAHSGAVVNFDHGVMDENDRRNRFRRALVEYMPALRRYAIALAGNAEVGDDLVQDCLERALRRWDSLKEEGRIGSWLRSILYNLYMDELRSRRSRGIQEDIAALADDISLSVPPQDGADADEFMQAMDSLSPEHRQILLLIGLEGLNYRETAQELQIPIGTVMSRLARARERLRHALTSKSIGTQPR